jgi:hypothetical protein
MVQAACRAGTVSAMKKAKNEQPETQRTPKGLEIPVPERADVERDLKKLVQPLRPARGAKK